MSQRTIPSGEKPTIVIDEVLGSLEVKGWLRPEITLESGSVGEQDLFEQGEAVHVHATVDCQLHVPQGAQVQVVSVHGGARVKRLEGGLKVGRVLGSLSLRDMGEVQIEAVYGDLSIRQLQGGLSVQQVLGNASLRQVQGSCSLERVAGNLDLRDAAGDLSASVGGNARLSFSTLAAQRLRLDAGGSLLCRLPKDASFQAELTSQAEEILVDRQTYHERSHQVSQGEGGAGLELTAGGMLSLLYRENGTQGSWGFTLDEEPFLGIGAEVEARIASQMKDLDEHMADISAAVASAGLPLEEVDRIQERVRASSARAQEKMQRAQERMKRKMEAAQRKTEHHRNRHSWRFVWTAPGSSPAAKSAASEAGASDDERLLILRMLEQKKITLEEAEKLLETLERK